MKESITIKTIETGESEIIELNLSESDKEILIAFIENVDRLRSSRIIKQGLNSSLKINYDEIKGISIATSVPHDDDLHSILHKLRPVLLHNEKASFNRVCATINKVARSSYTNTILKRARKQYQGDLLSSQIKIISNDTNLISEKTFMNWLNCHEYHQDQDKKIKLEKITKGIGLDAARSIFISILIEKIKAAILLSDFASVIVGQSDSMSVKV